MTKASSRDRSLLKLEWVNSGWCWCILSIGHGFWLLSFGNLWWPWSKMSFWSSYGMLFKFDLCHLSSIIWLKFDLSSFALYADPESPELVSTRPLTFELDCISVLTLDLLDDADAILPFSSPLASLQSFISWSMFYFWSYGITLFETMTPLML